jgi:hypothetical protein
MVIRLFSKKATDAAWSDMYAPLFEGDGADQFEGTWYQDNSGGPIAGAQLFLLNWCQEDFERQ